jgi:phage baseplate assembly protein W
MATDAELGRDLSCVSDCTPDFREVTGRRLLLEAVARRLTTTRGTLLDDPNYGFNVQDHLNDDMSQADIAAMQAGAEAECIKDERVQLATVSASLSREGVLTVDVEITDADGPFQFTLLVTAAKVVLQTEVT